jgi:hypothetical protein
MSKQIDNFKIIEKVCANISEGRHMIIVKAKRKDTNEIVWAIGDNEVCAVTREDCVRNPIDYNSVLIQEFPYRDNNPQTVGEWKPLIKELVEHMLTKYLEYDGLVSVYPEWLPEEAYANLGKELFEQISESCDYIILDSDGFIHIVPHKKN